MSDRSSSADSRAEARRRARRRAQGREADEEQAEEQPAATEAAPPGGMLTRLFPPAPPLPNRPDPLAGYTYRGPLSGILSGLYLLARSPRWWIIPGALWAISELVQFFARLGAADAFLSLVAAIGSFGALIGAGWFGWPRPWAFGVAAAFAGTLIFAGILGSLLLGAVDTAQLEDTIGVSDRFAVYGNIVGSQVFQLLFGAVAGWYGGYLRRRMASTSSAAASRRRPR